METKICTLFFLITLICTNVFAQPVITGQKVAGGRGDDQLTSTCLTKDGGIIVGGWSSSNISGEKTANSHGVDYWVVKYNSKGKIEWDKTVGGNNSDYLYSLQQTKDGGYILGGLSYSDKSGDKTQNSRGASDYWIVKLDNSGNVQWDKTIGGSGYDDFVSLQQTNDGGYILGGNSTSNKSGEKSENNRGLSFSYDYWLVKITSAGTIQWDKTIGGSGEEIISCLRQTSEGGYIIGGTSSSNKSGEKTENGRGFEDFWVLKLNRFGNIQWDKTIGGNSYDFLLDVQELGNGDYILGGESASNISGEKTENSRGSQDFWVVIINGLGNIQMDKTIGGSSYDELTSLQQLSDGGYILAGTSSSNISGEKTENSRGFTDYWVVKVNDQWKIQWDKTIGGNDVDDLFSIKKVEKNVYILGGYSESGTSGDKTQRSRGGDDYWLVKLKDERSCPKDISSSEIVSAVEELNTKQFLVYPNPVKNILHVQVNARTSISLINQSGSILFTKNINGKSEINITNLSSGLYYLKNNTTNEVQKVIVTK
jgi:hypothetical protein